MNQDKFLEVAGNTSISGMKLSEINKKPQKQRGLFLIRSEDDYFNYLSELLKSKVAAPPECREMLNKESVDWTTDLWDERWYLPTALIQHDYIECDTGAGTGFRCRGLMRYHPRSELLWCPNCHILFFPSFFEIKSSFLILNPKSDISMNNRYSGYMWPDNTHGAIRSVSDEALMMVNAIREKAVSLGWSYSELFQNVGIAYRDWGLVCFLSGDDRIGKVAEDFIEIIHDRGCTCFYRKDV